MQETESAEYAKKQKVHGLKTQNIQRYKIQKIEKEESEIWKKFDLNATTARVPCRRL